MDTRGERTPRSGKMSAEVSFCRWLGAQASGPLLGSSAQGHSRGLVPVPDLQERV